MARKYKKKKKKDPRKQRLTEQQRRAVEERAKPECTSNVQAIHVAYPKSLNWTKGTVAAFASEMFQKPHITYALDKERARIRSRTHRKSALTAQRVIDEFKAIALASLPDIVQYETKTDETGVKVYIMKITEFDQLTDDTKRAIKKMKCKTIPRRNEEGETEHIIQEVEFELYDKQKSLDSLAKYFDLYVEKLEVKHTGNIGVVHTTVQELRELFDSMTPEERSAHLKELTDKMLEPAGGGEN